MKNQWDKTYESIVLFKDSLEEYFSQLPQTNALRKIQTQVMNQWKEAHKNIREFDTYVSPVSNVQILFPTKDELLMNTWNFWKEYLTEQHGIVMRSRYEKKSLQLLWEISEEDPLKAIECLNYAMSKGYKAFFKIEANQKFIKPKEDGNPFA
jgi:hypothetical protein